MSTTHDYSECFDYFISKKIYCRLYATYKAHAQAFITHSICNSQRSLLLQIFFLQLDAVHLIALLEYDLKSQCSGLKIYWSNNGRVALRIRKLLFSLFELSGSFHIDCMTFNNISV